MSSSLYPLRFRPVFLRRIWGGDRLAGWLNQVLPVEGPIGEAWVLSDRDDHPSIVAEGRLQGVSLPQLMADAGEQLLGKHAGQWTRFPLLLKFVDAGDTLSVQVHPDDRHTDLLPPGERGKTEAWVVMSAESGSKIYAGLKPGIRPDDIRIALTTRTTQELLCQYDPHPGDCFFLEAGTVHAIGGGVMLFEIQQNSDVTFRLYDWDRVDAQTGQPRQLHIDQALACIDYSCTHSALASPKLQAAGSLTREQLVDCKHFEMNRLSSTEVMQVGLDSQCRIIVGVAGKAQLEHDGKSYAIERGDVILLPAEVGACRCQPIGPATLLDCGLPT